MNQRSLIFITFFLSIAVLSACQDQDDKLKQAETSKIQSSKNRPLINDDFSQKNPGWKAYTGDWSFQDGSLIQRSVSDDFPVILFENQALADVDVQVTFKPVSGKIDASGGIIFRATDEDNYYIVRANALEDNFRLYTFTDGYRHQLASATVTPPVSGQFNRMRVVAKGDHIQAYLDGKLQLDYHDATFKKGFTGLWTKADSVTVFDDFMVKKLEQ